MSFCVTLKGATVSYPQGYKAGSLFFFLHFSSFSQIRGICGVFCRKSPKYVLFFLPLMRGYHETAAKKAGKRKIQEDV